MTSADSLKEYFAGLASPFFLAPMAGFTDSVFRTICCDHGASLCYSEMLSAKGLYYNSPGSAEIADISPDEGPAVIQLFGSEPEMFRFAVEHLKDSPAVFFDINMGCPVPKVVKNGEGSALMKDPELACRCVRVAVESADRPVTVKIRKSFSDDPAGEISCTDFAKMLEDSGAAAIAVHGRSRQQFYSGKADWQAIKAVKEAVSVPVIGSGDVMTGEDAVRMLEETGCDAVMIARGARGNPWIFSDARDVLAGKTPAGKPDPKELIEAVSLHLEMLCRAKGEYTALREMRQHTGFYTKGYKGAAELRARINTAGTIPEFLEVLGELGRQ